MSHILLNKFIKKIIESYLGNYLFEKKMSEPTTWRDSLARYCHLASPTTEYRSHTVLLRKSNGDGYYIDCVTSRNIGGYQSQQEPVFRQSCGCRSAR